MNKRRKKSWFKFTKKDKKSYEKFLFSKNGILTLGFSILLGIFFGLFSLTETFTLPEDVPPELTPGVQGLGNVTPDRFNTFSELELRVVERTQDFCDETVGRIVTYAPPENMTVDQILKEIILDVETTNPFVWVSVRNEYDLDEQGRPFIDPTKKVFLTSFYYQDFQGVKDFLESHHVVFKGQMIMFQFKNPVKFCVPEFNDLTSNKIKGAGWTVGAYQDENFIDDDFKIPGDPNELEIEYVFKTELITNSRVDLSVQGFTPGFYWIKTKYKN